MALEKGKLEILKQIVEGYRSVDDHYGQPVIWRGRTAIELPGRNDPITVPRFEIETLAHSGHIEISPFGGGMGAIGAEVITPTNLAFDALDLMAEED